MIAYRGNETAWFYQAANDEQQTPLRRAMRLADTYANISGSNTHPLPTTTDNGLVNIPSSRFLRPHSKRLAFLEPLRLRRITAAMEQAARKGEIYHLWWHPHNFGVNIAENLAFLEAILSKFAELQGQRGMQSLSMGEIAELGLQAK